MYNHSNTQTLKHSNTQMNILAILPIFDNSKIASHGKLNHVNNKPLISYPLASIKATKMIDDLVIAPPSSKITALVSELNVPTILTKFTSDISELYQSTITQTLNVLKKNQNSNYDYIVIMNPTSPLLLSEDIDNTIKKIIDTDSDTAIITTPFHFFIWERDPNGIAKGVNADMYKRNNQRQQQMGSNPEYKPNYLNSDSILIIKSNYFKISKLKSLGKTTMYVVPKYRSFSIRNDYEFAIIETILKNTYEKSE